MNPEELRDKWRAIDIPSGADDPEVSRMEHKVAGNGISTLRDNLYRIYMRLMAMTCFGITTMVPYLHDHRVMAVVTMAYFLIMGSLSLWQALEIKNMDFGRMTVHAALRSVYTIQRRRQHIKSIGITMAVPLLCFLTFTFANAYGPYALYGAICGTAVGCICAFFINRRTNSTLREMRRQLTSCDE